MTFEQVYEFCKDIPGIYSEKELESLWQAVQGVPQGGRVLEVGVLYGRSSAVLLHAAQEKKLDLHFIDPWVVDGGPASNYFFSMIRLSFPDLPLTIHRRCSRDVRVCKLDLVHIDGDHSPEGIQVDCAVHAGCVKVGGVAVFHDYNTRGAVEDGGGLVFPQISQTVDGMIEQGGWTMLRRVDSQVVVERRAR